MDKVNILLADWAEQYFKSRDAFNKNIISINKTKSELIIKYKDKEDFILPVNELSQVNIDSLKENTSIITINNKNNLISLHQNWKQFSSKPTLKIYFINPFSITDKKWIINPHIHAKICDESALKIGLKAMYETVEPLSEQLLKTKLAIQS